MLIFLILLNLIFLSNGSLLRESCFSPIYCHGKILHMVQTAGILNDSKTFVDLSMKYPINETFDNFEEFLLKTPHPNPMDIQRFVYENFVSTGEIEEYWPTDYRSDPKLIQEIEDPLVKKFTENLVELWPTLARKVTRKVLEQPESYSIIPVSNGFIIPGGRFKEIYYWDTYWIVHGLLICDMKETARGMVENLLSLVERYGFVPNGNRVYYLNRSQPPLLTLMFALYVRYTLNYAFMEEHIHILEQEIDFWLTKRIHELEKNGRVYKLLSYGSQSDTPRPESYIEDIETCSYYSKAEEIAECYLDLKAGAESGWDFSSRWIFDKKGSPNANLSHIQTRRNLPADLNSFMYMNFMELYKMFLKLNNQKKAQKYLDLANQWKESIETFLWNEEDGIWYDYDVLLKKQRRWFYASNVTPLWAKAMDIQLLSERADRVVAYLRNNGIIDCLGGIPSSFLSSGLQWDLPNAWAPTQGILIFGLENSGSVEAKNLANVLAVNWVRSNRKAFQENRVMFEKYNSQYSGQYGGGGEYVIQSGFGWSNGVMLELINHYYRNHTFVHKKKKSP
ncbi:unnamed protein product [Brassicogethes aeneus]|uniref:Trehalase n=1 Tax=Brassicogethes aeneus TaxID=1431903 RepID=A0A9P0BJV8_BRAAE|nr:unnamed protein product [Brassicogethes aeneus]